MTTSPTLDPARTALLLLDFQNGVVGLAADADALLVRVFRRQADVIDAAALDRLLAGHPAA